MIATQALTAVQHSTPSQHLVLVQHPEGCGKSYDAQPERRLRCSYICFWYESFREMRRLFWNGFLVLLLKFCAVITSTCISIECIECMSITTRAKSMPMIMHPACCMHHCHSLPCIQQQPATADTKAAACIAAEIHHVERYSLCGAVAHTGVANHDAIAAAKGAVAGLTKGASATYAPHKIRVNCIAPGLVSCSLCISHMLDIDRLSIPGTSSLQQLRLFCCLSVCAMLRSLVMTGMSLTQSGISTHLKVSL